MQASHRDARGPESRYMYLESKGQHQFEGMTRRIPSQELAPVRGANGQQASGKRVYFPGRYQIKGKRSN